MAPPLITPERSKMFDFNIIDCATAADEGRDMEVKKPNGEVLRLEDGSPVTIKVHGRLSTRARNAERKLVEMRLEAAQAGKKRNQDDAERENLELTLSMVSGWNIPTLDGQPFPYSEENARKLLTDRRFTIVREQITAFINSDANFMKG